jgi:uncharacterized protein YdeI (BOF family)
MNKTLLIAAAVSLALSGTAFAGGSHAKRSAAPKTSASEITQKDCQMLTVESARAACMQSAVRGNGGIDSAAVGMSSDAAATGQLSGGLNIDRPLTQPPGYSSETSDPATYNDAPR